MDNEQNMDNEFNPNNLDMFIDWNDEDFLSPLFQLDNPHDDLKNADLMEFFNFEDDLQTQTIQETPTELAAAPTPLVVGSVAETQNEAQTIESASYQGSSIYTCENATAPTLVPNPLTMSLPNATASLINGTPSSHLSSTVQARPGIEAGNSSGQFVTPQRPELSQLHNHTSNSNAVWNSRSPQPFTTTHNQVGNASEMQQDFDVQSQKSMRHVNPMCPRSETYSNLQLASVTMPPNTYDGYRPMLSEFAAPSASILANYGQQPIPLATTSNSFGPGSSVPPTHPPLYENQDKHHHPQVVMPNGHGQQSGAFEQQWSQGMPNQISEYNERMNIPNLQRQSNTNSQAHNSRIMGNSSARTTGGTSSLVSNSREAEVAPVLRRQPSEAIRRILDMNPTRTVIHNTLSTTTQNQSGSWQIGKLRYEQPRRGRPRKKRDSEESSSQQGKSQKVASETNKAATTATSQGAKSSPDSLVNTDQNAIPANASAAPREFVNSIYDLGYERMGVPIDPHLRLFKPPPLPPPPSEN